MSETPVPAETPADAPAARPLLTVVRGGPSAEELAALVAVVSARAAGADEAPAEPGRALWAAPVLRTPLPHGPGAWRSSGLPR